MRAVHDVFFHPVIKREANDSRRNGPHNNLCPNAPRLFLLRGSLCTREGVQLVEEQQDNGKNGTQLNYNQKRAIEGLGNIEFHELLQQHHVARGGHGQPFSDALDHTEQESFQGFDNHKMNPSKIVHIAARLPLTCRNVFFAPSRQ